VSIAAVDTPGVQAAFETIALYRYVLNVGGTPVIVNVVVVAPE
jgi:hypothetical protein